MLQITEAQLDALTRQHLMTKLHVFLVEHARDPAVRALLADSAGCFAFWGPLIGDVNATTEHGHAVRLSYALACRARGTDPRLADAETEDAETAMMVRLEQGGVVTFADFDG